MASAKTLEHIFRDYISTSRVWAELHVTWPSELTDVSFQDWLLYDFIVHSISVSRSVVCTLLEFDAVHAKLPGRLIGPEH